MISRSQAREFFLQHFGEEPERCCCAPGRVNLIGEHIDYAGGQVLPLAIRRGVTVLARRCARGRLRVVSDIYPEAGIVELDGSNMPEGFAAYVQQLAQSVRITAAEIAIVSDLPPGQGLSSSAACGLAVRGVLQALNPDAVRPTPLALCLAAQESEQLALGTSCGLMDQYASMFGKAGHAILIDTWRQSHLYIPLPGNALHFVLVDSGQPRQLAASQYNQRHAEMSGAMALVRERAGGFACFRELHPGRFRELVDSLPDPARLRLRHLTTEQGRVFAFARALEAGDAAQMGRLLSLCQTSLRDDCEVSTTEIDYLVDILQELPDCLGCRLVGGGFGGSVLALLATEPTATKLNEGLRKYEALSGLQASWLQVQPGPGAWTENSRGEQRSLEGCLS